MTKQSKHLNRATYLWESFEINKNKKNVLDNGKNKDTIIKKGYTRAL